MGQEDRRTRKLSGDGWPRGLAGAALAERRTNDGLSIAEIERYWLEWLELPAT